MTTITRALQYSNIYFLRRYGVITQEEFLKLHAKLNGQEPSEKQERVVSDGR